jgi:hypothetical protein
MTKIILLKYPLKAITKCQPIASLVSNTETAPSSRNIYLKVEELYALPVVPSHQCNIRATKAP